MKTEKIKAELVVPGALMRHHCHVCGGTTDRVHVVTRVTEGPHKGLTICEDCLKAGDIRKKMIKQAELYEYRTKMIRDAAPNIEWPTYEEWKAMDDKIEEDVVAFQEEGRPLSFTPENPLAPDLPRCLILCGGHEFGTQSYAGEVRFYRNSEDNVQVAIPNGMRWSTAVENLKKVTEDLEFWISTRTDTTIEDLDIITEREVDSPFPPF